MWHVLAGVWPSSRRGPEGPLKGLSDNPAFQWWRAPSTIQPHSAWGRAGDARGLALDAMVMRDLGVQIFRFEVPWRELEPLRPRALVWRRLDLILDVLEEHSIAPLPVVVYAPPWATDDRAGTGAAPPRHPESFGGLMGTLATRYRGRCAAWELWNEPDHPHSWAGTLRDYVHLILRPGSEAVREADPHAKVVLGGLADHRNLQAIHAAGGADLYDIASIHHYPRRASVRTVKRALREARATLRRRGLRKPVWLTECGIASREPSLASSFGAITDEAGQAIFVRTLFEAPGADAIFLYQLRDTVIFDAQDRRIKEVFWGLTDESGARRKPAYESFRKAGLRGGRRSPGSDARKELVRPTAR